jgi:LPS sulfotransferase NodH
VFAADAFDPIDGYALLTPLEGHKLHICKLCHPALRAGKRPKHAYHFPPPNEWLTDLNPAELQLAKPCVSFVSIRRLFGASGAVQFATQGFVCGWENHVRQVALKLPRLPSETDTAWVVCTNAHKTTLKQLVRPEKVRRAILLSVGRDISGAVPAGGGRKHLGYTSSELCNETFCCVRSGGGGPCVAAFGTADSGRGGR